MITPFHQWLVQRMLSTTFTPLECILKLDILEKSMCGRWISYPYFDSVLLSVWLGALSINSFRFLMATSDYSALNMKDLIYLFNSISMVRLLWSDCCDRIQFLARFNINFLHFQVYLFYFCFVFCVGPIKNNYNIFYFKHCFFLLFAPCIFCNINIGIYIIFWVLVARTPCCG